MGRKPQLLDRFGNPVRRSELTKEIAAPTTGGIRSPITGYPGNGLNPARLATILREADHGDPVRYMELAETVEERDAHYMGVLGTRRRSVSQLEIIVEPADDSQKAEEMAQEVRTWLKRDELTDELYDMLDAIGKGYSFTEIVWDASEGQHYPAQLEWRDPRWFRFARHDLATPLMLADSGQEVPLPAFRFIFTRIKAKSGLALRSGVARVAFWSWMFKAFTQRDWAIWTQTYGQPLRIGKYGPGTSDEDRAKLFRAVANIAGDCAAIVPESMMIDFVESKNVGSSTDLYERRSDWLDKQTSKLVLGQTATTDAETGGLGSGKEHREVQEDIERADAKALSAIINRDLIRPWMHLNHGPDAPCPRLKIGRPEEEDLAAFSKAIAPLIARGLRVKPSEVYDKFGLSEPGPNDDYIGKPAPISENAPGEKGKTAPQSAVKYPFNTLNGVLRTVVAAQVENAAEGAEDHFHPEAVMTDRLSRDAAPGVLKMLEQIETMLKASGSFEEFGEMLKAGFPNIDASELAEVMGQAMHAAHAGGIATIEDEAVD